MSDSIQKVLDFFMKIIHKISRYYTEIRSLLSGDHREITIVGLFLIVLQSIILCCCFSLFSSNREQVEPTISNNEIAATIIADLVEQTLIAPQPTEIHKMEPTVTLEPTKDQITLIFDKYQCIPKESERIFGQVIEVVDGDTIKVKIGLETYSLRYIGIDCPECKESSNFFGLYASEALEQNKKLVEGREVLLIKDVSDVDQYDRLLRYVFVDTTFVNYELVRNGYAKSSLYPPDIACNGLFIEAENQADYGKLGFWSSSFLPPTETPKPTEAPREACDPCYPNVCIPKVSYDLNCGDIVHKRFQCICDPHGFDGDNDGIGCES